MRTRRPSLLLCVLLFAAGSVAACGGAEPIEAEDLLVRVEADITEVDLGRSFPLTVVRVWNKELEPAAWDEGLLAPLVVRSEGVVRREDAVRVEERHRYRAYAFTLGDIEIPSVRVTARPVAGGRKRLAMTDPVSLRVRRALATDDPGEPEFPGDPLGEPQPLTPYGLALALVLLALVVSLRSRRRAVTAEVETPAARTASQRALDALRSLREREGGVAEAADIVRDYVAEQYDVDARRRTTDELVELAVSRAFLAEDDRDRLRDLLGRGDLVKYAAHIATDEERARYGRDAEHFVETREEATR